MKSVDGSIRSEITVERQDTGVQPFTTLTGLGKPVGTSEYTGALSDLWERVIS